MMMIEVGSVRQTNKFGIAVTDWSTNWGWKKEEGPWVSFFKCDEHKEILMIDINT